MTRSALLQRLKAAQAEIRAAVSEGRFETLPSLVAAREGDIRNLTEQLRADDALKPWAREYLREDRNLLAAAQAAQVGIQERIGDQSRRLAAHRSYMQEGR